MIRRIVTVSVKETWNLDWISCPALSAKVVDANHAVKAKATVANAVQAARAIILDVELKAHVFPSQDDDEDRGPPLSAL